MDLLFNAKVDFILLLGRSLHGCGAAAHHLERALTKTGMKLDLHCELLAFPTGIIASFSKGEQQRTVVIRTEPGQIDLSKLSRIDEAADLVIAGKRSLLEGTQTIESIHLGALDFPKWLMVVSYALASGGMITALRGTWTDLALATLIGLLVGVLDIFGSRWLPMRQLFGALASFISVLLVSVLGPYLPGLSQDKVILAGVIVLLPGLALVVSFVELSTKNLLSGTARLAGATGELLKVVFTVALTKAILKPTAPAAFDPNLGLLPAWTELPGVAGLAFGFLLLFRVRPRNMPSAFLVSVASYCIARIGTNLLGTELTFFVAGAFVAMVSNLLARILRRPGLITMLPGIILIVPGSINYNGFIAMFERDVMDTVTAVFTVVIIAVSIVAGMFFGNTVIPPRRSL
ncbi:MAG TPA: threonine/serine exporter family protein [Oligoflexus sp.]|uniref:threonine/serine ThrE exporter family protein n=1 Tax=Oligoflexus sp. TaxID=1971216 RepID=UPI002D3CB3AC|nr:threonine/serine exporter family protein [Oligoflexus sp.]HYX36534.1 threonine/serine exporter family protein [Oligoflexus sp.]